MGDYCIYIHTNLKNGKVYIGKAIRPVSRGGQNGNGYKNCPRFGSAIQSYGGDNFSHDIILKNLTEKEANKQEQLLIKKYDALNPDKGYNLTEGGTGGNTHVNGTQEQKEHYSQKCREENKRRIEETDGLKKLSEAQSKRGKEEKEEGIKRNHLKSGDNPMAKAVRCVETGTIFPSCADAAEGLGYKRSKSSYVSRVASGIRKTCKGYHWEFINE